MKKILLAVAFALALAPGAGAQSLTNAQAVKEVVPYLLNCSSTTVGTAQRELTGNTSAVNTTAGISKLLIENLSSGATEYFSNNPNVTASTAPATGFALYPLTSTNPTLVNSMWFPISTMQTFYGVAATNGAPLQLCTLK